MAEPERITIDVVSDVICPWCFIGKRRLARALRKVPDIPVDIRWRPFQLDASIPAGGMPRRDYLKRKFGSAEKIRSLFDAVTEAGLAEGIAFAFERIAVAPNTLDAHRLIRWAAGGNAQDELVERLFTLYFLQGADIGDRTVLEQAAGEIGMRTDLVADLLSSSADIDETRKEISIAHRMGITAVPCFILDNRFAVIGAETPATLAAALRKAAEAPPRQPLAP